MKINLVKAARLITLLFFITEGRIYAQNKTILRLAREYSRGLQSMERQKHHVSIEQLLRKGKLVAARLHDMENLDESDYAALEKAMRGFVINRQEVVYLEPDAKFYVGLSRRKGTTADRAFFQMLSKIKPDSVWPAYIEQETDYGGCTIFGTGILSRLYGQLVRFSTAFPNAYRREVKDEIRDILSEFDPQSAPCRDHGSIRDEFKIFTKSFPKDKNIPEIRRRFAGKI